MTSHLPPKPVVGHDYLNTRVPLGRARFIAFLWSRYFEAHIHRPVGRRLEVQTIFFSRQLHFVQPQKVRIDLQRLRIIVPLVRYSVVVPDERSFDKRAAIKRGVAQRSSLHCCNVARRLVGVPLLLSSAQTARKLPWALLESRGTRQHHAARHPQIEA